MIAQELQVQPLKISRIWNRGQASTAAGEMWGDPPRKRHVSQSKTQDLASLVINIPLIQRRTIRSLSQVLGMPKSVAHDHFKKGNPRFLTNAIKLYLTDVSKTGRI